MVATLAPALDTLNAARKARADADVGGCLELARQAIEEAMEEQDWETAYRAAATPGRMYLDREEAGNALPHLKQALHIAKSGGLVRWLPCAYLNLSIAYHESGSGFSARRHIQTGLDMFRDLYPHNRRFSALIANLTWQTYTLNPTQRTADDCAVAYRALTGAIHDKQVKVYASARQMRCGADAGLVALYRRSRQEMFEGLEALETWEGVASDLVHGVRGARKMEDTDTATRLMEMGLALAEQRGEGVIGAKLAALA